MAPRSFLSSARKLTSVPARPSVSLIDRPLLTPAQLGERLGKSARQINRLVRDEHLPCVWIGSRQHFSQEEVETWLRERRDRELHSVRG